jgi:GNAT superfamily N-acetyltransferase
MEASEMQLTVVSLADRPKLADDLAVALRGGWPEFIFHDPVAKQYLARVEERFADLNLVLLDEDGQIVAGGWGVPLPWDGSLDALPAGWDAAMQRCVVEHDQGATPDTLCTMAAQVRSGCQGRGLGGEVLRALHEQAVQRGLRRMIAPVRPTLKSRYPLTPIERFITWTRDDGAPLDPWLRTHWRLGATILRPAPRSMVMTGTVAEWEQWTQMRFPESGRYVVPDALDLVVIDREHDRGEYVEPNVWMRHL